MEKPCNDVDKTCAFFRQWAAWIAAQPVPPMIYGAFQRSQSTNRPRPLLGVAFQEGAGVEHWRVGPSVHAFPDLHAVVISARQGVASDPVTGPGGLWIASFDLTGIPGGESLLDAYHFHAFPIRAPAALRAAFLEIFAFFQRPELPSQPLHLKAAWFKLLAQLEDEVRASGELAQGNVPDSVQRAITWINQHYQDPALDQAVLARAACLDPHHFGRLFKRSLGTSPMRYLRRFRLRQAAYLIETTDRPIGQIAAETGFADPQHFSRLFSESFGHSPREHRLRPVGRDHFRPRLRGGSYLPRRQQPKP